MIREIRISGKNKFKIAHIRRSLIRDAMIMAARKCANDAYLNSQEYVPILNSPNSVAKLRNKSSYGYEPNRIAISRREKEPGALRSNSNIIETEDGVTIQYKEKYASYVERGTRGGEVHVRGYTFNSAGKNAGVSVDPYTRFMPANKPRYFIADTMKLHFENIAEEFHNKLVTNFKSSS